MDKNEEEDVAARIGSDHSIINYPEETIIDRIIKKDKIPNIYPQKPYPEPLKGLDSMNQALQSGWSDRDFNTYLDLLGITKQDLGSLVLDIGSGKCELFARKAQISGINVISVNPKLSQEKDRITSAQNIKNDTLYERKVVAALSQALPFKDGCFDTVVSVDAVPCYVSSADLPRVFQEILRVLKPGGKAFFSPISLTRKAEYETILRDFGCSPRFKSNIPDGYSLTIEKSALPVHP